MNLYVGNFPFETAEDELRKLFEDFGEVSSANVLRDKYTGKSRGFGFVEMPVSTEALKAVEHLNGKDLKGRPLRVNEAQPRTEGDPSKGNSGSAERRPRSS
jgi:RNA recognition motif-containing protein